MRCDVLAQGVVDAAKEINISVPLVVRLAGTLIFISFAASTTPWARTSHLIIPPKILIKIPLTFLSERIILRAAETFSFDAAKKIVEAIK
jgi:hypothetical protein